MMTATSYTIESKLRTHHVPIANINDFALVESGPTTIEAVMSNPNLSLYCLDDANRQAVFVETPAEADVLAAPFLMLAQYEHAERVVTVPYDHMPRFAEADRAHNLVLIYSMGRCGSTLLSNVFNYVENVSSLSEPDVYTQIILMREADPSREAELRDLLRYCTYALCTPLGHKTPESAVIKFRSMCLEICSVRDMFHEVFPEAKEVFLYRNTEDWAKSMVRAFKMGSLRELSDVTRALWSDLPGLTRLYLKYFTRAFRRIPRRMTVSILGHTMWHLQSGFLSIAWMTMMQAYMDLMDRGVEMCALRYEEMVESPQEVIGELFEYCDLPTEHVEAACAAFGYDSQKGTDLARAKVRTSNRTELEDTHISLIRRIMQNHPVIKSPRFIAPRTLRGRFRWKKGASNPSQA